MVREIEESVNKPQKVFLGKCVIDIGACDFIVHIFSSYNVEIILRVLCYKI